MFRDALTLILDNIFVGKFIKISYTKTEVKNMRSLKIICINDLIEVHTAFNFFKSNFLKTTQTEVLAFLPLSDIYQSMVDNMQQNSKLQLLAILDDQPVGCVICQPLEGKKGLLAMPILAVKHEYRGAGIATKLLEEIEKNARKKNYFRLITKGTETSISFFKKHNFQPYLYVTLDNEIDPDDFKDDLPNEFILTTEYANVDTHLKYMMPENTDENIFKSLTKKYKKINFEIYFEKRI